MAPVRLTGARAAHIPERSLIKRMTGAMYAGIAGLKTHMQNLNVIGNNIANINTDGDRKSVV